MSALDVNERAPELGMPPTVPRAGPPTSTTCADRRTARGTGKISGRHRPVRTARDRPTSGAGCTRDRAGSRRPYDDPKWGRLSVDRNLVDDLAERGGHDDVRGLHGAALVAVVGPPDVRDERALLDAEE